METGLENNDDDHVSMWMQQKASKFSHWNARRRQRSAQTLEAHRDSEAKGSEEETESYLTTAVVPGSERSRVESLAIGDQIAMKTRTHDSEHEQSNLRTVPERSPPTLWPDLKDRARNERALKSCQEENRSLRALVVQLSEMVLRHASGKS
jgi:hypothetical protein